MLGRFNVLNLLASLAIIHARSRSVPDSIRKVCAFKGVDGRMESVQGQKTIKLWLIMHIRRMHFEMH